MSGRGASDSEDPRGGVAATSAAAVAPESQRAPAQVGAPVSFEPPPSEPRSNRRLSARLAVTWSVDCETEDTFLYASITNISEMGIFVRTTEPLPVGTQLTLRFAPLGSDQQFVLDGIVQWVNALKPLHDNPNPGMGIRFSNLTPDARERIVDVVRTIAYVRESPSS